MLRCRSRRRADGVVTAYDGRAAAGASTQAEALTPSGLRRVLITLCVTETTSWGVLYYAFPVMSAEIARSTGWSMPAVTAAFSVGQLVAAFIGIPVGRRLDRHGPRAVMTAGSILATVAVAGIATAQSLSWFVVAWLAAGVAMGAVLYPPAFAALTRWHGRDRVRALMILTLAAGCASTVFAPLTAVLAEEFGWRRAYLMLGLILAVVTVPGHWAGLRGRWPDVADPRPDGQVRSSVPRSPAFLALTTSLALATFGSFAVVVHLVPLLVERGVDTTLAALALGLGGVGQVAGRLGYSVLSRHVGVRMRTALILLACGVTTALFGVFTTAAALIAASVAAGVTRGVLTLVQASAVSDRWGHAQYGRLTGLLSAPLTIAAALAPWAGAAMAELLGGYAPMFLLLAVMSIIASALSLASTPRISTPLLAEENR
ncbi:cyanate permease [Actinoalloteichus sp. GBA129-24]|nr:cyanate permease [Actinoalloteichus sp. GBA129-24]